MHDRQAALVTLSTGGITKQENEVLQLILAVGQLESEALGEVLEGFVERVVRITQVGGHVERIKDIKVGLGSSLVFLLLLFA